MTTPEQPSDQLVIVDTYKRNYLRVFWLTVLNAVVIALAWPQLWWGMRFIWLMSFAILCGWTERWNLRSQGWKEPRRP